MIGFIGAMQKETDGIISLMTERGEATVSGIKFVKGKIEGKEAVVATCGIGKVFAGMCAQTMILKYAPEAVINVGVAGSLLPELKVCQVVVADKVVEHDMDTSPLGDPKGLISGINVVYMPCDEKLCEKLTMSCLESGIDTFKGTVASGDQFLADPAIKANIATEFGACACEMEGAAIGQVCYVNTVPFAVLRAISDGACEDGAMDYLKFCDIAAKQTVDLVKRFMSKL